MSLNRNGIKKIQFIVQDTALVQLPRVPRYINSLVSRPRKVPQDVVDRVWEQKSYIVMKEHFFSSQRLNKGVPVPSFPASETSIQIILELIYSPFINLYKNIQFDWQKKNRNVRVRAHQYYTRKIEEIQVCKPWFHLQRYLDNAPSTILLSSSIWDMVPLTPKFENQSFMCDYLKPSFINMTKFQSTKDFENIYTYSHQFEYNSDMIRRAIVPEIGIRYLVICEESNISNILKDIAKKENFKIILVKGIQNESQALTHLVARKPKPIAPIVVPKFSTLPDKKTKAERKKDNKAAKATMKEEKPLNYENVEAENKQQKIVELHEKDKVEQAKIGENAPISELDEFLTRYINYLDDAELYLDEIKASYSELLEKDYIEVHGSEELSKLFIALTSVLPKD
ncbi:hypothetical protein CAAN1_18S01112 [[Candida] anglica]|uniref:Uncharacterized protein n=1 Tax=[Candida] anglica TaxID=148631 RepID=A0ABP0ELT7_9ASCO